MVVTNWSFKASTLAYASAESVAQWWFSPERKEDFRKDLVDGGALDVSLTEDSLSNGRRVREIEWKTADGAEIHHRIERHLDHNGQAPWIGDRFIVNLEDVKRVHGPGNRERLVSCHAVIEFIPSRADITKIVLTHRHRTTGAPWWERFIPPIAERAQGQALLTEYARRCEAAVRNFNGLES